MRTIDRKNSSEQQEQQLKMLMQQTLAGDAVAYRTLLTQVNQLLQGYFRAILQRHGQDGARQVDDLVQEVLLAVHDKKHTYSPDYPFLPWLRAIARYKWVDYVRMHRHSHYHELLNDAMLSSELPHQQADHVMDVASLLDQLPAAQRRLLTMVKLDGFSLEQAAKAVNMNVSAAKVSVHRGLKKLAGLVDAQPKDGGM